MGQHYTTTTTPSLIHKKMRDESINTFTTGAIIRPAPTLARPQISQYKTAPKMTQGIKISKTKMAMAP